ncbi:hypothetical protein [Macrococcus animalis]|uniref:hypothetical protein n=1 Tax=Macrococcus animalis TaxID=3395467 RepID=UPI0039BE4117
MYSKIEKYIIKHFGYGIVLGFIFTLLLKEYFYTLIYSEITYENKDSIDFLLEFLQSTFTIAILYTLGSIVVYIFPPDNKSINKTETKK